MIRSSGPSIRIQEHAGAATVQAPIQRFGGVRCSTSNLVPARSATNLHVRTYAIIRSVGGTLAVKSSSTPAFGFLGLSVACLIWFFLVRGVVRMPTSRFPVVLDPSVLICASVYTLVRRVLEFAAIRLYPGSRQSVGCQVPRHRRMKNGPRRGRRAGGAPPAGYSQSIGPGRGKHKPSTIASHRLHRRVQPLMGTARRVPTPVPLWLDLQGSAKLA